MSATKPAENGKYRVATRGMVDEDVFDTRNRHVAAHQQRLRLRRIKNVLAKRTAVSEMEADVIQGELARDLRLLVEAGALELPDIADDTQLEQLLRDELQSHESRHGAVDGLVDGDLDGNVDVAMDLTDDEDNVVADHCDEEERMIQEALEMEARDIEYLVNQMNLNQ
ncbi:hypothetical protein CJU90_5799 [Yarrowia sp. C11]|nr:hypothetical protein CJU90_5799 [Yarrowia sp. C11]KAG5364378.1 hypothetical protein CKK34_3177 [Yarrowia sp. E02]